MLVKYIIVLQSFAFLKATAMPTTTSEDRSTLLLGETTTLQTDEMTTQQIQDEKAAMMTKYEQQLNKNLMTILNALEQKLPELGPEGLKIIPHIHVLKEAVNRNIIDYSAVIGNIGTIARESKIDQLISVLQLLSVKKGVRNSRVIFEAIDNGIDAAAGVELKNYGVILSEVPKIIDVIVQLVQSVANLVE